MTEPKDRAPAEPAAGPRWASVEDLRAAIGDLSGLKRPAAEPADQDGPDQDDTGQQRDPGGPAVVDEASLATGEIEVIGKRTAAAAADVDGPVPMSAHGRPEPEDAEPEDAEPEDAEPEDAEPEDAEPEESEPEDAAPEHAESQDADPEDAGPEKSEPEESEPEESEPEKAEDSTVEATDSNEPRTPGQRIDAALRSRTPEEPPITRAVFVPPRTHRPKPATAGPVTAIGATSPTDDAPPAPEPQRPAPREQQPAPSPDPAQVPATSAMTIGSPRPASPDVPDAAAYPTPPGMKTFVPSARRSSRVPMVVGGVLGTGLLIALVAMFATKDVMPRDTTIGGVDVGGLSRDAAVSTLEQRVPTAQAPLPVSVGGQQATVDPAKAGLSLDAVASVDDVLGGTLSPSRVWHHIVGGQAADAAPAPDRDKLAAAVQTLASTTQRQAADGSVKFASTGPQAVDAVTGIELDQPEAANMLAEQWLARDGAIELPVQETQPKIRQDEVDRAVRDVAGPAAAGDLSLEIGDHKVTVPQAALLPTLSMAPSAEDPTKLALVVDGAALRTAVLAGQAGLEAEAKDAKIVLQNGLPTVIPSQDGVKIDPKQLAAQATKALQTPQRTVTLTAAVVKPKLTTEQATALGVKEKVSTFSTNLTANPGRTENLRIAARTVNGTLVKPGETFSLNQTLGRRTVEKGYNEAPAILNGRLQKDVGGGVSQMATTIFNNVFFAGMQDVTHKPHSFYISRYPEGREATVNYPTVDLKWKNDTKYGVLIEASATSQVTVSFWSTKIYDKVEAFKSPRRNIREPKQIHDASKGCVEQAPSQGFDVTVTRKIYQGGRVLRTNSWATHYIPEDHVICAPEPTPAASPSPSGASRTAPGVSVRTKTDATAKASPGA